MVMIDLSKFGGYTTYSFDRVEIKRVWVRFRANRPCQKNTWYFSNIDIRNHIPKIVVINITIHFCSSVITITFIITIIIINDTVFFFLLFPKHVKGVKFLWDCVTGRRIEGSFGCIMADEMVR